MSAIMTDDELAAAVAEWAKHRGPMTLACKIADHVAATHGAKAEPQPVSGGVACQECGGDGYYKGPRLGDEPCPKCAGTGAQPQPVPVSPLALWIADKSFALAIECLRMGKPLTADDMAKLVEQTVVASIAAAARIEGGA